MLSIIVAIDENNAIGKAGRLLCHLPNDLKHFKQITLGSAVLMGRQTFLSLPKPPLPNRRNIVLTTQPDFAFDGVEVVHSIDEALALVSSAQEEVFVIGGGKVYSQMLPFAEKLYITHIHHRWDDADTFFPAIDYTEWKQIQYEDHPADERHPYSYTFAEYIRR